MQYLERYLPGNTRAGQRVPDVGRRQGETRHPIHDQALVIVGFSGNCRSAGRLAQHSAPAGCGKITEHAGFTAALRRPKPWEGKWRSAGKLSDKIEFIDHFGIDDCWPAFFYCADAG